MKTIRKAVSSNVFILALEQQTLKVYPKYQLFNVITAMSVQKEILILLRKVDKSMNTNITYLPLTQDRKFAWINKLQAELKKSPKVVLVSEKQHYCGLLGKQLMVTTTSDSAKMSLIKFIFLQEW